jgi:hypothetical protein
VIRGAGSRERGADCQCCLAEPQGHDHPYTLHSVPCTRYNELVEWFNQVDATYRADLLQLNELNFDRFEAKLDQRITHLDAKWSGMWQGLDAKLEQLETKVHGQLAELDAKWERRAAELRVELNSQRRVDQVDVRVLGRYAGTAGRIDDGTDAVAAFRSPSICNRKSSICNLQSIKTPPRLPW